VRGSDRANGTAARRNPGRNPRANASVADAPGTRKARPTMMSGTGAASPCPSCGEAMAVRRLDRKPVGEASVDLCIACRALWFDGFESPQLAPGATLELLRAIHDAEREPVRPLRARLACPRCSGTLALTRDLQRTTRFSYYRCSRGHGRFTPFAQFLLEKDFVRPLPPPEVERLKSAVGTIRCSGCGAGIDLSTDSACRYCRAPVTVLDPDALSRTVASLSDAEAKRHRIDPQVLADALMAAERPAGRADMTRAARTPDAVVAAIEFGATALDLLFGPS